ncbi:hypothetical protein EQM14_13535 [Caproiciproducens sp. NJN-50]|uniref:hypothetical protein n=1 Tax=Acutalibacteraceae TaxID=3082771 RepID=UPI000FFE0F0F|nr:MULTISPECIES: hypothetical protein [Acutalibacteraceae]QAT50701.1 hypothetical protein EQM14_13535 [Caproiciproducens sp. NJN-50]
MLIAIEGRDCPVCETIRQSQPDGGLAYLPSVSVRFLLEPRELRLQYEAGRLRYDLNCGGDFRSGPGDAIQLYRKTAAMFAAAPSGPDGGPFNEIA